MVRASSDPTRPTHHPRNPPTQADGGSSGYGSCFDTDIIIGPPACRAKWAGPGGIKERLFGPTAGSLPLWTREGEALQGSPDEPIVRYTAGFLPSVYYHRDQPWNNGTELAMWRYPLPVDFEARGLEPTYFPLIAWKVWELWWFGGGVLGERGVWCPDPFSSPISYL
jgi:hypothetical protein